MDIILKNVQVEIKEDKDNVNISFDMPDNQHVMVTLGNSSK